MSLEEFERHKEALALKKLEKPKTTFQKFSILSNEIAISQYHFERNEAEVAILRKITKEEFLNYFKVTFFLYCINFFITIFMYF